jgi:hypothetical protein
MISKHSSLIWIICLASCNCHLELPLHLAKTIHQFPIGRTGASKMSKRLTRISLCCRYLGMQRVKFHSVVCVVVGISQYLAQPRILSYSTGPAGTGLISEFIPILEQISRAVLQSAPLRKAILTRRSHYNNQQKSTEKCVTSWNLEISDDACLRSRAW